MRALVKQAALAACGLALAAPALSAQATTASDAGPRLGILVGLNSSTFGGGELGDGADRRTGLAIGGYGVFRINPAVSFRPELLYARKGAAQSAEGDEVAIALSYVEAPLLLQFAPAARGATGVRPHFYVGPTLALRTGCEFEVNAQGVSASVDCENLGTLVGEQVGESIDTDAHTFDVLGTVGGGIAVPLGGRDVTIGARYSHGFSKIFEEDAAKNRVLTVYGSIEFPLRRR